MKMLETLQDLYRHMEWADALVWRSVLSSEVTAESSSIKSIFHHLHMVQFAFYNVWREAEIKFSDGAGMSPKEIAQLGHEYHASVREYIAKVEESSLDRPVVLPWAGMIASHLGFEPQTPTFGDTLFQVTM